MNNTLRNILYFFSAVILAKFVGIFTTFTIAKILSPSDYGLWVSLMLIASYSPIICLGTCETLIKQYPYYSGMGEMSKAKEIEDGVLGSTALSAIVMLIAALTFHVFISNESVEELVPLIRIMGVSTALGFFSFYFYYRFTAHQNFKIVSFIDTTDAIAKFVLLISLSWLWGIKGLICGVLVNTIIILILSGITSFNILGKVRFNFNLKLIWEIIKIGFPITILWWIYNLQTSADRVISIYMLGKTSTGYYGLGVNIISTLTLIPMVVGRVLYPRINEELGKNTNQKGLSLLVITPSRIYSLLVPALIGILILISPTIYYVLFPKYSPGLASAQILLLATFFICLVRVSVNYLIANHKQNMLLKYFFISLILNISISVVLVRSGFDIKGIAIGTTISIAFLTFLIWKSVFKYFGYDNLNQIGEILKLYLPFIGLLVVLGFMITFIPNLLYETGIQVSINIFIFIAFYSAFILTIPPMNNWLKELNYQTRINLQKSK